MSLHLGVWVGHGQRSPDRSQTAKDRLRPVTRDCSATLQNLCLSDFEHKCWKKAIGPPSTYPPTPNSEPWTLGSPWQSDMHGAMFVVYLWFHTNHKPETHLTSTWNAFIFLYLSGSNVWGLSPFHISSGGDCLKWRCFLTFLPSCRWVSDRGNISLTLFYSRLALIFMLLNWYL